jgi:hypothetical protein
MLGPWRTIILAIVAILAIVTVVILKTDAATASKAMEHISMIAGGGALYRYFADRGKSGSYNGTANVKKDT